MGRSRDLLIKVCLPEIRPIQRITANRPTLDKKQIWGIQSTPYFHCGAFCGDPLPELFESNY
jgi:hypothetical protein